MIKMKTLVLGASGQIGAYVVQNLVEFSRAEVISSSRKLDNVKRAMADLKGSDVTRLGNPLRELDL